MPSPLTWDSPNLTYDSPFATWDGTAVTPKNKSMSTTKAITDFSRYTAAELGPKAQYIHDQMLANAGTFTAPTVGMPALAALLTGYHTKLAARASRDAGAVIAFNTARNDLEAALGRLGNYVNDKAQGDAAIVEESGFPSYNTARPALAGPPAAPTNLRVRQGDMSGSFLARYQSQRQPSTNEVQVNTGNPNTEADWLTKGIFKGQSAEITGLTPGTRVWVRVRTVGLKGVMGDWSDAAEIMVT